MFQADRQETMRSSRKNRSNSENLSHRRNVDQAKAARAKAAIKAAKSQSPKSVYKKKKFKAAVDLETPKSLLVNIRLKSVINLDTYNLLSREEKKRLVVLLPSCDQPKDHSGMPILNSEALNNEFFAKACVEWCERLGEGEFVKDRQQGDASWKGSHNGALDGAKSHVNGSLFTDANLDRSNRHSALTNSSLFPLRRFGTGSGSRISVKQLSNGNLEPLCKVSHRRARNSHLQLLTLDDGASLTSDSSSELPLSLCGAQLRVGSSRARHGGDSNSAVTLEKSTKSRVTLCEMSSNNKLDAFVHPALRDHDYVWPLPQFCAPADSKANCKSKLSRGNFRSRYRRKRNRKHTRSKKRVSVGIHQDKASEMEGHGFRLPRDLLIGESGTSSKTDVSDVANVNGVLQLNGAMIDCRDYIANSQVLSVENALFSNPLVKSNGRLNGAYSPNKREQSDYVASQHNHLANVAAHNSRLKENDVNLNYVIRPPGRLKTVLPLRKCEQTDGMPLIQIQSSDWLSRLTSAKCETVPPVNEPCNKECPSVCFSKTDLKLNACDENFAFPASDSQSARTAPNVDGLSTSLSNSVSLHGQDSIQSNELQVSDFRLKSDDAKFFVKFIGIQKIPFDHEMTDVKDCNQDLVKVDEVDSLLKLNGSCLPSSVLQKVRQYVNIGGNFPHIGQYSPSSSQCNSQLTVEQSVEKSFHSNGIRSQEDYVVHTSQRQTDSQEKHLSSQSMQDFKFNTDLRNRRANCNAPDSSDCVWEAVMQQKDTVHHVH